MTELGACADESSPALRVAQVGAVHVQVDLGSDPSRQIRSAARAAKSVAAAPVAVRRSWISFLSFNSGFYLFYLFVGISQESIYHTKFTDGQKFTSPLFLVLATFATNTLVAYLVIEWRKMGLKPFAPWRSFALLALSHSLSLWCANQAMLYLDYPTQTLFKSCKPLPVFVAGVLCFKHGYSSKRGVPVLFVCVGLLGFMYLKITTESEEGAFSTIGTGWLGTAYVCGALALDGVTGYLQDLICKGYYNDPQRRSLAPWHLMLFVNLFSAGYSLSIEVGSLKLFPLLSFVASSGHLVMLIAEFSLSSALGQLFVYYLVATYDSLTCCIMTTLRKFLTIVLSIFLFRHKVLPLQWVFILAVFAGIAIEVYMSHNTKKAHAKQRVQDIENEPGAPRSK